MEKRELEIGWGSLWRVLVIVALGFGVYFAQDALLALFIAIIISSAVDSPIQWLNAKLKIPRMLGAAFIFATAILIAVLAVYLILPVVFLELSSLSATLRGTAAGNLFGDLAKVLRLGTGHLSLTNLSQVTDIIFKGASPVAGTLSSLASAAAFGVSSLIIAFYLTLTRDGVARFLKAILPDSTEDWVTASYYRSKRKIARWIQAQLVMSIIVGVVVSSGLWLLGVKYSLVIGLIAAVFEIMPVVGPIFSGAVGTLIALSDSLPLAVYTLVLFLVVQQLESHVLVPLFTKKVIDIHPVTALFALLAGYQIFGVVGMLISVPVAVVIQDVVEEKLSRRNLSRFSEIKETL